MPPSVGLIAYDPMVRRVSQALLPLRRRRQRSARTAATPARSGPTRRPASCECDASTCQPWIFHGFTLVSYSAGISACEKGEQWQRALALLSEMWEAKLEPNVISYNAGISACEKGEQWQRALALLSEMWEAKLEPDVIYTTIPGSARANGHSVSRGGFPRPGGGPPRSPALRGQP